MKKQILLLISLITIGAGMTRSASASGCDSSACKILSIEGFNNIAYSFSLSVGLTAQQAAANYSLGPVRSINHATYGSIGAYRTAGETCLISLMADDVSYMATADGMLVFAKPVLMCGTENTNLGTIRFTARELGF